MQEMDSMGEKEVLDSALGVRVAYIPLSGE
jgi:hypothetical protein